MTPEKIEAAPEPQDITPSQELIWPADRFYWGVVEGQSWKRVSQAPQGLLAEVAETIPVPFEQLHAVAAPLDANRTVVIAVERQELASVADNTLMRLAPSSMPAFLGSAASPDAINMLVGDFEPPTSRRARTKWHVQAALAVLLIAALLTFGLFRRAAYMHTVAQAAAADLRTTLSLPIILSPHTTLEQELAVGRRVSATALAIKPPSDAMPAMLMFLKSWPNQIKASPQSASVTASEVNVSIVLQGDSSAFLSALQTPSDWTLDEPRMNSNAETTRMNLRFLRKAPAVSSAANDSAGGSR